HGLGNPPWAEEPRFAYAYRRWVNREELDRLMEQWTIQFTPQEVTQRLQQAGVATFPSLSAAQLMKDPHLLAREAFSVVEHPDKGRQRAVAPPWRFSSTPAQGDRWTPSLGEHNVEVFHGLLGLSVSQVKGLEKAKVIW
ncbi:MAG: CoA transferase, partial [candidate division NC10 bacterium]